MSGHDWVEQASKSFPGPKTAASEGAATHSQPTSLLGGLSIHAVPVHRLLVQEPSTQTMEPPPLIDLTEGPGEAQDITTEVSAETVPVEGAAYESASTVLRELSAGSAPRPPLLATMLSTDRIIQELRNELANF